MKTKPETQLSVRKKKMEDTRIAGALFDFCGYLTTLKKEITVGSKNFASPIIDHLQKWARERGLNLEDADVKNWDKREHKL